MAYVAGRGERASGGVVGPPRRLARSLQVGGHEVRDLELRGVHRAGMPGPGRGALGLIVFFFRKFFWKKTTFGRILYDGQKSATFIHLQLAVSLPPTLPWPQAFAHSF